MDKLDGIKQHEDVQSWWGRNKDTLRSNITAAMKDSENKETFKLMLELLENVKIKEKETNGEKETLSIL